MTIHNSFVLYNCAYCKLQLCTVCDLSATMYVTYACTVYTGHIAESTHYGVVWWEHNGGSKDKGEGGWDKCGSHRDQHEPNN